MKLIAERTPVDVALIPIGGHYTMDRQDAVVAAELIGAGTVIPMHYNTFPPIETEAEAFKADVESKTSSKVVLLSPGRAGRGLAGRRRQSAWGPQPEPHRPVLPVVCDEGAAGKRPASAPGALRSGGRRRREGRWRPAAIPVAP